MIYVLEVAGAPLAKTNVAYAYTDLVKATQAARVLGAKVVEYRVGHADAAAEDAWREAAKMMAERNQARGELEDHMKGNAALRQRYDATSGETMHQWIARLYAGYRKWTRILDQVRRMDGDRGSEELEP